MLIFKNVVLLSTRGDLYGNENLLLCKVGRLLVVHDRGQIKCYLLNAKHAPVVHYTAQKLMEECLAGTRKCADAFRIPDQLRLSEEPDVCFREGEVGSGDITFNLDPIELKAGREDLYNLLVRENEKKGESGENHFVIFKDMVEMRHSASRVKVFVHNGTRSDYDVTINICKAEGMLGSVPYFWDVYYDASSGGGIEYNPALLKLHNVRPLHAKPQTGP